MKTAIFVELADEDAEIVVRTPFGLETVRGSFYVVAEGSSSYCASPTEFEAAHEEVAPNRWVKRSAVHAYEAAAPCRVETRLADGSHETTVDAGPGDWIVRQHTGEVMVLSGTEFSARYEPAG